MRPRGISSIDQTAQLKHLDEIEKYRQEHPDSNLTNKGIAIVIGKIALVPDGDKIVTIEREDKK